MPKKGKGKGKSKSQKKVQNPTPILENEERQKEEDIVLPLSETAVEAENSTELDVDFVVDTLEDVSDKVEESKLLQEPIVKGVDEEVKENSRDIIEVEDTEETLIESTEVEKKDGSDDWGSALIESLFGVNDSKITEEIEDKKSVDGSLTENSDGVEKTPENIVETIEVTDSSVEDSEALEESVEKTDDKREKDKKGVENKDENGKKKKSRTLLKIVGGILLFIIILCAIAAKEDVITGTLSYNQFMEDMESGYIDEVKLTSPNAILYYVFYKEELTEEYLKGYYDNETEEMAEYDIVQNRRRETIVNPNDEGLLKEIALHDVEITVIDTTASAIVNYLIALFPTFILIGFMLWFIKFQFKGDFNKPKKVIKKSEVKFADVAGMTEEKEELLFAIRSLQNVEEYVKKGVKPVKGILLEGPPGVGKTMLAKAVAGEAGVNFFSYSGSDFVEMFVGLGARRVRNMFEQAEASKPCVVFIDEIDALGRERISGGNGGTQEADQTLVALLERMDGLTTSSGILFIAATNRVDALDKALLRPGRFDKTIHISPPKTKEDRIEMVKVHSKDKVFEDGLTVEIVAKQVFGMTGAEIAAALNDAVLESFKDNRNGIISLGDIDKAIMKLYAKGLAKGRHKHKDLKRVAIHEVGHALMNRELGRPVVKVSVQPYTSGIGGVTQVDGDNSGFEGLRTKTDIVNDIKVCYAGKVAEECFFNECSVGASNDLERATLLLRDYVGTYCMQDNQLLSLSALSRNNLLIGANETLLKTMNEKALEIYSEVKSFFDNKEVQDLLYKLAVYLVDNEVIYDLGEVVQKVQSGETSLNFDSFDNDNVEIVINLDKEVDGQASLFVEQEEVSGSENEDNKEEKEQIEPVEDLVEELSQDGENEKKGSDDISKV